jgi:DNA-binding MarR family transcriptional regulator
MFMAAPVRSRQTLDRNGAETQPLFTPLQGQYLAFIHAYTLVNGRPPAEADMMRFFRVTPPTVHRMVLALEQAGLISRQPGLPRSIVLQIDRTVLPMLEPSGAQTIKTSVQRY